MIFAHDPEYVAQLGRCIYGFLSVEWLVIELVIRYRDDLTINEVASFDSGQIAAAFVKAMSDHDPREVAPRFQDLARRRNDLLHTRPATVDGKQRLYRWDIRRGRAAAITDTLLAAFLADAERLSRDLDMERSNVTERVFGAEN